MRNKKSTGFFRARTVSLKSFEILTNFINKYGIFCEFSNFSKIFQIKFKALGDLLISFFEIIIPKGCLGGINQNSIFGN